MPRLALTLVVTAGLLIGALPDVHAHGTMITAEPRPDSVTPDAPDDIWIEFAGELDIAASSILISGSDGASVATGPCQGEATASGTTVL
ncbi:MAG: hypothetical protein ACRD1H_18245, partial [Vicinamibacterales bacterium]